MDALCLDCCTAFDALPVRCPSCFGRRLISHTDLSSLTIAHVDCDAFYAAVEKRDNPTLRDKPLIIGGTSNRGVVSTACYIARMHGVHSAMPMYKARKLCPSATIIPPNMATYREVSRQIRAYFHALTPSVEPLSIDEAFLDLTGTRALHRAPASVLLARLARDIERDIGITVSIGLSHNKFLAKLASDLDKPRGFSVIGRAETQDKLAPMPVTKIYGVGKATFRALQKDGLTTIGQLQSMEDTLLVRRYGSIGLRLARLARGEDDRSVSARSTAKSVSSERTLSHDLRDLGALQDKMWRACEQVSHDLKAKGIAATTLTLKLKTSGHRSLTRSKSLSDPTQLARRMYEELLPMLAKCADGTPYRLIGVGASKFSDAKLADPVDLAAPERERQKRLENAVDALRDRFGPDSIALGRGYKGKPGKPGKQ